ANLRGRQAGSTGHDASGRMLHRGSCAMTRAAVVAIVLAAVGACSPERLAPLSVQSVARVLPVPAAGARAFPAFARTESQRASARLAEAPEARRRQASVTYARDVAPLIVDRCAMCHHPGGSAPFSPLHHGEVKRRASAHA